MDKVDLRHKATGEYPPEIQKLIDKHKGVIGAAEREAGVSLGWFGKIRKGSEQYSDYTKTKVQRAISGQAAPPYSPPDAPQAAQKLTIPDTCPPELAALIRFKGSKVAAVRALGTSEGSLYAVMKGVRPMPPVWITRGKVAMGLITVENAAPAAPATPQGPEFVPWDGKSKGIIKTKKYGAHPSRTIKGVPKPIVDLVEKYEVTARAAKAMGVAGNTLLDWADGTREFTIERQKQVHAAFHGISLTPEAASDYDTYKLDLAIVILKGGQNFDRVNELAEALGGLLAWKKNTKDGWLLIYSMRAETAAKFKRLAKRDASEIACP